MPEDAQLPPLENQAIRTAWNEEKETGSFSVVDVVWIPADAKGDQAARNCWKATKTG